MSERTTDLTARYDDALLGLFGPPGLVIDHGEGCEVVDVDGRRYLDLFGGIAVSALGHAHPALVDAVRRQAERVLHVSNFFTTREQVTLAEHLLRVAEAPAGSRVFFCGSGTEANEAALKLARRTGRPTVVAAENAFHGRTFGALSLTGKEAIRAPFEPLVPGVRHVPYDDVDALRDAVDDTVAAVVLEPVQGEAGVVVPSPGYLRAAREITEAAGALLVLDEVQTGVGRTGRWFAHHAEGIVPDAVTVAKGLGGGVPIGALVTYGERVSGLLAPGDHGTTFGGNPLACAAGEAVLRTVEDEGLLEHAREAGEHLARGLRSLDHPLVAGEHGVGLMRALDLAQPVAPELVRVAREHGFLVNAAGPTTVRLVPALVVTTEQIDRFVQALPGLLDQIGGTA